MNETMINSLNTIGLQSSKPHAVYGERWIKVFPMNEFDLSEGYVMQAGYGGMPTDWTTPLDNIADVELEMTEFAPLENWSECEF